LKFKFLTIGIDGASVRELEELGPHKLDMHPTYIARNYAQYFYSKRYLGVIQLILFSITTAAAAAAAATQLLTTDSGKRN